MDKAHLALIIFDYVGAVVTHPVHHIRHLGNSDVIEINAAFSKNLAAALVSAGPAAVYDDLVDLTDEALDDFVHHSFSVHALYRLNYARPADDNGFLLFKFACISVSVFIRHGVSPLRQFSIIQLQSRL